MVHCVLDNDVLIKGAHYLLLDEMAAALGYPKGQCGIVHVAKFVCTKQLERKGSATAIDFFNDRAKDFALLEPTSDELLLAADVELLAQQQGLQLDVGESICFALVEFRKLSKLATGDKRAVIAIENLVASRKSNSWWSRRVWCFEQIISRVLLQNDPVVVRDRICFAEHADRSLAISFRCTSKTGTVSDWQAGLESYISDLRSKSPTVLAA